MRVEFEEDNIRNTSGDGTFELDESIEYRKGPTPHNRIYFEKHLDFANSYFKKASDSSLFIKYKVFPEINDAVFKLNSQMERYSPANVDVEEKSDSLMAFVRDVLKLIERDNEFNSYYQSDISRNNSSYKTVLAVFHAGATSLTDGAVTGIADSPSDISSSFISQRDFNRYSNIISNSNYLGVENMLILPERATQDIYEFRDAGIERIEFGISGIIVHQIFRALGLPVLYNTEKGTTVAGRFSPLDFGGYINDITLGVVPVMPGAWERYYLGWNTNIKYLENFGESITLSKGDILKIPHSSSEYFLVEFRQKSPNSQVDIFTRNRGLISSMVTDSTFIKNHETENVKGIVVDVDNYDFLNPATGLVVWYVNNSKIERDIFENRVNVGDNGIYGVRVFEADLDFSIGYDGFVDILGTSVFDYGSESDMLKEGESVKLSGFENIKIPYSIHLKSIFGNSAEIVVENSLFSYEPKTNKYDSLNFFPKYFDTISNVGQYNLQAYIEDENTIKVINFNDESEGYIDVDGGVKQFAFIRSLANEDPVVAVLSKTGSLYLYSLAGRKIPVNATLNNNIKYFIVGDKENSSIIMTVDDNSSFDIRKADFTKITKITQGYRISRQESDFPIFIPTSDSIGFSETEMFSVYNDTVVIKFNLSEYIDIVRGVNGLFSALGNDSLNFKDGVHFFFHPNPVKKSMRFVQAHFYSSHTSQDITESELTIYTFSGRKVKSIKDFEPVRGWNRVDVNIGSINENAYLAVLKLKVNGKVITKKFRLAITR